MTGTDLSSSTAWCCGRLVVLQTASFSQRLQGRRSTHHAGGLLHQVLAREVVAAGFEAVLHGGGDPVGLLKKYGNRWKLMHVKDLKKGVKGDFSGHTPAENDVPVGTGQGDWKTIVKLAKKNGIKHMFIEDESEHELEYVPMSIKYLKSL